MITTCPHCGCINNEHDGPRPDDLPKPGDVALCWGCGGLAIFTEDGVRELDPDESAEIERSFEVRAARAMVAESFTASQASELRWASTGQTP